MTDPIADMLTRVRNASAVRKSEVILPLSKIKYEIAKIMEAEGWIQKAEIIKSDSQAKPFDELKLWLKYRKSGRPVITSIKRISKPGLRVYVDKTNIPVVLNNLGIAILSTSSGIMTSKDALKKGVGGEVICEIY